MDRPSLVPELYVTDLENSLDFYVETLGFKVEYDRPREKFTALSLGGAHLMLEQAPSLARATREQFEQGQWRTAGMQEPFGRGINLEIDVPDVESLERRLAENDYPLLLELHEKTYRVKNGDKRVRRLLVADPDGYLLRFSETLSSASKAE
jgi:catechol 2,3-dioxygenase-like lactoylglutathione lyase family enzyme